jgi:hypothetical protein
MAALPAPVQHDLRPATWLVVADVVAKALLAFVVVQVAIDPGWGNLEGKAPGTRALTYPLLAIVVPALHFLGLVRGPYPWGADLLVTIPGFSDLLGNRLDFYDHVVWFDDLMHVVGTGCLAGAAVILSGDAGASLRRRLAVALAWGMTLALSWEVWELVAFVRRSAEIGTAYADTVGDLGLGWVGAALAAVLVGRSGDREAAVDRDGLTGDVAGRV